jgi:hypothetical protein
MADNVLRKVAQSSHIYERCFRETSSISDSLAKKPSFSVHLFIVRLIILLIWFKKLQNVIETVNNDKITPLTTRMASGGD